MFKDYYPPTHGGVEQHINDVVHSMKGLQFAVLTSSGGRQRVIENDDGIRVIRSKEIARIASTPITPSWGKLLRSCGADLLHFHMPNPFGEMAFQYSRAQMPMIATYHADIIGRRLVLPFFAPFRSRFLKSARLLVVSSANLRDGARPLHKHRNKVVVIPFGVDPSQWSQRPPSADRICEEYPGPLLVALGRLAYYKGIEVLIDAMMNIEATCLVVGDGPKRFELEEKVGRLRLAHKVRFIGEVPDDQRTGYYHAADLFVMPSTSRAETFGISMLEAMACGTPAISTEVGTGTSWLNQNDQTGLVVSPGDPAGLAAAIKTILGDRSRRYEMGHAARERVSLHFTSAQMLDSLASLYRSI